MLRSVSRSERFSTAAASQRPFARARSPARHPAAALRRAPARPQGRAGRTRIRPRVPPRIGSPSSGRLLPPVPPAQQGKTARRAATPARRQPARSCFHSRCSAICRTSSAASFSCHSPSSASVSGRVSSFDHRPPPFPCAKSAASRGHRDRRCGPRSRPPSRCIAAPARRAARRRRAVRRTRP